jgi:hypothetical protein
VVWNRSLAEDWRLFHGDDRVEVGYPVKLNYVVEQRLLRGEGLVENPGGMVMYPASSSSNAFYSHGRVYQEELEIIRQVCEGTSNWGVPLLIKPKPNGRKGEFDRFLKKYSHVRIGQHIEEDRATDYRLDSSYNQQRLHELSQCQLVLNAHTTFALDSAAYGLPVMQFAVRDPERFPVFSTAMKRHHVKTHFLKPQDLIFEVTPERGFDSSLKTLWDNPQHVDKTRRYAEYLRDWLRPERDFDSSMERITDLVMSRDLAQASR